MSRAELIALVGEQARRIAAQDEQIAAADERIAELEAENKRLGVELARLEHLRSRNSGNSSMPPSKDGDPGKTAPEAKPARSAGGSTRKRGKQLGAPGANLAFTNTPDERVERFPSGCCDCGRDLAGALDLGIVDRYQQHDIPPVSVRVTEYGQHRVRCACGQTHTATRPDGAARSGLVGYGPNLQAFAVYLMVAHFLPVKRCAELLESLTGAAPSVGFVHGMLARAAGALGVVQARIRELITGAHAVCADETPLRVGPKTPKPGRKKAEKYLLVACTERYTLYQLGDRDLDTFKASVLPELTRSVIVHDRYQNYDSAELGTFTHQLCCAHLLRDLASAGQTYPEAHWPTQITEALQGLIHQANLARDAGATAIPADMREKLITLFRDGVTVGLSETTGHGDRPGERTARCLLEVLRDRQDDILRFADDLAVPPTSNQAERDLRPAKIQQHSSGRLTSEHTTRDRYTIRGYLSTAAKHGLNQLNALRDAVLGRPWMPPDPAPA